MSENRSFRDENGRATEIRDAAPNDIGQMTNNHADRHVLNSDAHLEDAEDEVAAAEEVPLLCLRRCNKFVPQKRDANTCFCGRPKPLHTFLDADSGFYRQTLDLVLFFSFFS